METYETDPEMQSIGDDGTSANDAPLGGRGKALNRPAAGGVVSHPTPNERVARGKTARVDVPRRGHGDWEASPTRPDPVALLEEQATSRVPELVPVRYGRMLTSPFAFYRGAAYIMASDLAPAARSGLDVQLCGDAHLSNFGGFAAPDRRLVFSINDFDETLPGPFEWDVKRLVASFAIAGRELGVDESRRHRVTSAAARSYRNAMREFAAMRTMDVWYARLDLEAIVARWGSSAGSSRIAKAEKVAAKAKTKDSMKALGRLTQVVGGRRRIVSDPPMIVPIEELLPRAEEHQLVNGLRSILRSYRRTLPSDRRKLLERFDYHHAARKVVGVGSVGTRAWIVLLVGRDEDDPLFLQFKEAGTSVLEPFLGKSRFANHGQRVVEGQRMMQSASDVMLGWNRIAGVDGEDRDCYIRQLWDGKASADLESMDPKTLKIFAEICGWTLARAHARSGDAIAIAAYLGSGSAFDEAMTSFAEAYADQNERDFAALAEAVATGRVVAELGA